MVSWKKRGGNDSQIDFETLEDIIADMLESFPANQIDFSKPLKLGLSLSLDEDGCIRIDEFGLLKDEKSSQKKDELLYEVIQFEKEVMVVLETGQFDEKNLEIKLLGDSVYVSNKISKKILKRIHLPCEVEHASAKQTLNNDVLEIRVSKKL